MTPSELTTRVVVESVVLLAAVAAGAAVLGGAPAACGTLAGGGLVVANFRWLTSSALAASAGADPGRGARWLPWALLRFAALVAGAGVALVSGWAHPVALVVGLTVVPCAVVAAGLRGARREARG
jgi:hypothetical protein